MHDGHAFADLNTADSAFVGKREQTLTCKFLQKNRSVFQSIRVQALHSATRYQHTAVRNGTKEEKQEVRRGSSGTVDPTFSGSIVSSRCLLPSFC